MIHGQNTLISAVINNRRNQRVLAVDHWLIASSVDLDPGTN